MPPPALLTPGVQGLEHTCDGVLVGRITTGVLVGKTTVGFHVRVGSGRFKSEGCRDRREGRRAFTCGDGLLNCDTDLLRRFRCPWRRFN